MRKSKIIEGRKCPKCNSVENYELDELYWFVGKKSKSETRENVYLMTMISALPRQIVGFEVQLNKSAVHIQSIVDNSPWASISEIFEINKTLITLKVSTPI